MPDPDPDPDREQEQNQETDEAAGISNRPLDEEQRRQERVPPPGTGRGETDPALPPRPEEKPAPRDPVSKRPKPESPPPE